MGATRYVCSALEVKKEFPYGKQLASDFELLY